MSHYRNDTGTGNVLRSAHPKVRKLILDSMRFWVREMHVDGFRFDLASIFTRRDDGSIDLGQPAVIADISGDQDFAISVLLRSLGIPGATSWGAASPAECGRNGTARSATTSAVSSRATMARWAR
jgi:isoamylase